MTAFYHLWNWHLLAPHRLRAYLTEGDAVYTGHGTDQLIATACLAAGAGIATSWRMVAVRTPYFTSYRDPEETWDARYALAWQLTVELAAPPSLFAVPVHGFADVDGADASYDHQAPPDLSSLPCLVIADFRDRDAAAAGERHAAGYGCAAGRSLGEFPSLAIDLGPRTDAFYQNGAGEAEDLLDALVDAGASVHIRDTMAWRREVR